MKKEKTRICYKIVDGFGEVRRLFRGKEGEVEISVEPECDGFLSIGNCVFKLEKGKITFNTSLLDDGVLSFALVSDKRICLEPVLFDKGKFYTMPISEEALRRLLIRAERLEDEQKRLSNKIGEIEKKLGTPFIF